MLSFFSLLVPKSAENRLKLIYSRSFRYLIIKLFLSEEIFSYNFCQTQEGPAYSWLLNFCMSVGMSVRLSPH